MKLLQFRQGFATNSSSSHSNIITNPLTKLVLTGKGERADDFTPGEFGWEPFTISSEEGRMEYYAYMIGANLDLPFWMKEALAYSITGIHITEDGYIDHQSVFSLPRSWKDEGLDQQFLQELKTFLLQDGITIIGGNDNSEDTHSMAKCGPAVLNKMPHSGGDWVCRKNGDEWTLFDRKEGAKLTFTLDNTKIERTRPNAPELIDIKITNFCPYACSFCYQNSTAQGKHADQEKIRDIVYECEEHKVFEVAIGGGEPTLHPDFEDILHAFRSHGVVPNFTTRNLSWLRDEKRRPLILKECGAFAVSVDESAMVKELGELIKRYDIENKVVIHYVLGSAGLWTFEGILREAHAQGIGITLLGWKTTGRGATGPLHDNTTWLDVIKQYASKFECPRIGIDTCIANEYEKEIKLANIPDWLFYTEEGKFSMYYDAVEEKWGPSSFCEDDEYVKVKAKDGRNMIEAWNKIKPTKRMKGKKNVKSVDGV